MHDVQTESHRQEGVESRGAPAGHWHWRRRKARARPCILTLLSSNHYNSFYYFCYFYYKCIRGAGKRSRAQTCIESHSWRQEWDGIHYMGYTIWDALYGMHYMGCSMAKVECKATGISRMRGQEQQQRTAEQRKPTAILSRGGERTVEGCLEHGSGPAVQAKSCPAEKSF